MKPFTVIWTIVLLIMLAGAYLLLAYKTMATLVIGLLLLIVGLIVTACIFAFRKELQNNSNSSG